MCDTRNAKKFVERASGVGVSARRVAAGAVRAGAAGLVGRGGGDLRVFLNGSFRFGRSAAGRGGCRACGRRLAAVSPWKFFLVRPFPKSSAETLAAAPTQREGRSRTRTRVASSPGAPVGAASSNAQARQQKHEGAQSGRLGLGWRVRPWRWRGASPGQERCQGCCRRHERDAAAALAKELGPTVVGCSADITSEADVAAALDLAQTSFGDVIGATACTPPEPCMQERSRTPRKGRPRPGAL